MEEAKAPEKEVKMETPTPQVEVKPETKKKEKKNSALPIIIAILSTLVLCVVAVIVYLQFFNGKDAVVDDTTDNSTTEVVEEDTDEDSTDTGVCLPGEEDCEDKDDGEEEASEYENFEGEVLSSTMIPTGWRVIEYMDGDGTESLLEGETYEGLTGLAIVNPQDVRVFSMAAVTGIGFAGCYDYTEFADDSPSYRAQMESDATDMGETLNVTDYTSVDYEEFEFLGTTVRRVGEKYFYDTLEGNNYFEAPCFTGLITLEGLTYEDSTGYTMEAYFYGAEDTATSGDLLVADQILDSLDLVE